MTTITASCPKCDAEFPLPATAAGRRVECPECDHVFRLGADHTQDPEPPAGPAGPATQLDLLRSIRLACWVVAGVTIAGVALSLIGLVISLAARPAPF